MILSEWIQNATDERTGEKKRVRKKTLNDPHPTNQESSYFLLP